MHWVGWVRTQAHGGAITRRIGLMGPGKAAHWRVELEPTEFGPGHVSVVVTLGTQEALSGPGPGGPGFGGGMTLSCRPYAIPLLDLMCPPPCFRPRPCHASPASVHMCSAQAEEEWASELWEMMRHRVVVPAAGRAANLPRQICQALDGHPACVRIKGKPDESGRVTQCTPNAPGGFRGDAANLGGQGAWGTLVFLSTCFHQPLAIAISGILCGPGLARPGSRIHLSDADGVDGAGGADDWLLFVELRCLSETVLRGMLDPRVLDHTLSSLCGLDLGLMAPSQWSSTLPHQPTNPAGHHILRKRIGTSHGSLSIPPPLLAGEEVFPSSCTFSRRRVL